MKFLRGLIFIFIIPVLISVSLTFAFNRAFLNPVFLKAQLLKADIYNDLASYLPEKIMADQKMTTKQQNLVRDKIKNILNPAYLQQQVEGMVDQTNGLATGKNKILSINFDDALAKLNQAGVPVDKSMLPNEVINLDNQPTLNLATQSVRKTGPAGYVLFFVLLILLVALSWLTKTFVSLISFLVIGILVEGGFFVLFKSLPNKLLSLVPSNDPYIDHFLPKIKIFVASLTANMSATFLLLLGIAVVALIAVIILDFLLIKKPATSTPQA